MEALSENQKQCVFHFSVCHGTLWLHQIPLLLFSVIFLLCLPILLKCMLLFCPMLSPEAGSGIPAQWGPYNWEPCLLFSPLPPTSSPFHFFPIDILSFPLSEHMDCFFKSEPSPHQRPSLRGSICCSFPESSPSTNYSEFSLHSSYLTRMLHS